MSDKTKPPKLTQQECTDIQAAIGKLLKVRSSQSKRGEEGNLTELELIIGDLGIMLVNQK